MWFFGKKKKEKKQDEATTSQVKEVKAVKEEPVAKEEPETCQEEPKVEPKEKAKTIKKENKVEKQTKASPKQNEETVKTAENVEKQKKSVYRVVFDKEDKLWKIKKDGAKRVIDSKKTKEEALARVQELSKSQDTKFVVYKKDGKFQKKSNLKLKNNDQE